MDVEVEAFKRRMKLVFVMALYSFFPTVLFWVAFRLYDEGDMVGVLVAGFVFAFSIFVTVYKMVEEEIVELGQRVGGGEN